MLVLANVTFLTAITAKKVFFVGFAMIEVKIVVVVSLMLELQTFITAVLLF